MKKILIFLLLFTIRVYSQSNDEITLLYDDESKKPLNNFDNLEMVFKYGPVYAGMYKDYKKFRITRNLYYLNEDDNKNYVIFTVIFKWNDKIEGGIFSKPAIDFTDTEVEYFFRESSSKPTSLNDGTLAINKTMDFNPFDVKFTSTESQPIDIQLPNISYKSYSFSPVITISDILYSSFKQIAYYYISLNVKVGTKS